MKYWLFLITFFVAFAALVASLAFSFLTSNTMAAGTYWVIGVVAIVALHEQRIKL